MSYREKQAQRLARLIRDGEQKQSVALAGKARLWASQDDRHILVGYYGRGNPVVVMEREGRRAL